MVGCTAPNCSNNSRHGLYKFHRYPSNEERRKKWLINAGREDWMRFGAPTTNNYLCNVHFTAEQFENNRADGKKMLRWNAVPTIFEHSNNSATRQFSSECSFESTPIIPLLNVKIEHSTSENRDSISDVETEKDPLCETEIPDVKENVNPTCDAEDDISIHEQDDNSKAFSKFKKILATEISRKLRKRNASDRHNPPKGRSNMNKMCRICFRRTQLEDIFVNTYRKRSLHNLLETCASIKIDINSPYKLICCGCKNQLLQAYKFISKVVTSNDLLPRCDIIEEQSQTEKLRIYFDEDNDDTDPSPRCHSMTNDNFNESKILQSLDGVNKQEATNDKLEEENQDTLRLETLLKHDHTYVEKSEKDASFRKRSYLCSQCGLSVRTFTNLKIHVRRIHEGIKTTYSTCGKCNISFRSQASYETHRSRHVGKHHCCEHCGKLFAGMAHLRAHLYRHTSLRPFSCRICNKSYRTNYLLKYHLVTHTKQRKHACKVCNRTYMRASDLKLHRCKARQNKKCNYKSTKKKNIANMFEEVGCG